MIDCFLALGSNMGDRLRNISIAKSKLSNIEGIEILKESYVYESNPMYNDKLDKFYNSVLKIRTKLTPRKLLSSVKDVESNMGRKLDDPIYSSRIIDVDILTYGEEIINSSDLVIPHPHIKERKFVLKPWADIDSQYIIVDSNQKISDLLENTSADSIIRQITK